MVEYAQSHPQRLRELKREGIRWMWQTQPDACKARINAAGKVRLDRLATERKALDWQRVRSLRAAGLSWARVAFVLGMSKTTLYGWAKKEL